MKNTMSRWGLTLGLVTAAALPMLADAAPKSGKGKPSAPSEPAALAYADNFKLLANNVYMLDSLLGDWAADTRAAMIAQSDYIKGYDAVILNEIFDNGASAILLNGLSAEYPNQTPVLGRTRDGWNQTLGAYSNTAPEDGGVSIVSPWPIEEQIQFVYSQGCGADWLANKGFVYAKINKNGSAYHVIGTHAQAEDGSCSDPAAVRASQFQEMQNFIASHNIPVEEIVFMGGDFNVIKGTNEYPAMMENLQASEPNAYAGYTATWDPESNGIAYYNYPDLPSEYLDYIFVSRNHAQPTHWHNQALDAVSDRWSAGNYQYQEFSDHYPISAFSYADENTPTQSARPVNQVYSAIHLKNQANGKYVQIDAWDSDGWLNIKSSGKTANTSFELDNWYPQHAFCLKGGDFVKVQGNARRGWYWNWWLGGGSGNYAYYTKNDDASNKLRISIVNDDGDCLKNGDQISFVDRDTVSGKDYYMQRWTSGSWTDYMFLWSSSQGSNETFTVEMEKTPEYQQWGHLLRYAP